jgi:chromosome segregation ATPase
LTWCPRCTHLERDAGAWSKSKDAAVEEFNTASKHAKRARRNLSRAKHDLEEAGEEAEQEPSPAALEQVTQLEALVATSDAAVREQRSRMKHALASLARFEPDFPEVMVHLESALPRELLQVWRPDCALEDMCSQREKLAGGGRHDVWR